MPSVNRDIAKILGRTEAANTDNVALGSGSGLTVYATLDDLPTSGLSAGDQAFITSTNRIYVSNGTGWYNVALFNATPTLDISPSGAVTLATDGSTPTVITLTGADSDNAVAGLTYSVESDGSFVNIATLSQDSSVFTITPLAEGVATPGSSTLTFKVSDGISFGSGTTTVSLSFSTVWAVSNSDPYIAWQDPGQPDKTIFAIPANSAVGTWRYDETYTSASGGTVFGPDAQFVTVPGGVTWNGQTYNGYYQAHPWFTGNGQYEIWNTSVSSPAWTNEANAYANAVFAP
jgi:hypothetical protein